MSSPHPPVLGYDDLPPGSDLRRERVDEPGGGLLITAPAGDPPPQAVRAASLAAMPGAAFVAAAVLLPLGLAGLGVFRGNVVRLSAPERAAAVAAFLALAAGAFLLAWWVERDARLRALSLGRRQSTILLARPHLLRVETAGPFGNVSRDLPAPHIGSARVERGAMTDTKGTQVYTTCLCLPLDGPEVLRLLPGRDEAELRWVLAAVRQETRGGDEGVTR